MHVLDYCNSSSAASHNFSDSNNQIHYVAPFIKTLLHFILVNNLGPDDKILIKRTPVRSA